MKHSKFQIWSEEVRKQIPLMESEPSAMFNAESWIVDGELQPVETSNVNPSTLDELVKAGLVEK